MAFSVMYESGSHPVRFRTIRTFVFLFFRVAIHMHLERFISPEKFIAHRAGVFDFFCVDVDVTLHNTLVVEIHGTMRALIAAKKATIITFDEDF